MEIMMLRNNLAVIVAFALLGSPTNSIAKDVNYVFYTVETIKWGSGSHQVALPRVFPSGSDMTASGVVSEAFHRLKSFRGGVYSDATVTLDAQFASTGAVTVACGKAAQNELHIVSSEIYWTLKNAGAREIRIPELKSEPIGDKDVAYGSSGMVMQLWQVLPPGVPGSGLVIVGDKLMDAGTAARKIQGKDRGLLNAVTALLKSPLAYVRLKAVESISRMKPPGVDQAFIVLLKDKDATVKMAVIKAFEGSKNKRVLVALENVVQTDTDSSMKAAAVRILIAAGNTKYAVFALFDKLKDPDDAAVMDAVEKLSKENKPEVAIALIDVLTHRNAQVRQMAMNGIVGLKNMTAIKKIMETDAIDMVFRNKAANILAKESSDVGDLGLKHLAENGDQPAVLSAIAQIADRRRYKLTSVLMPLLNHSAKEIRVAAASALGKIKDSKGLSALTDAYAKHTGERKAIESAILSILGGLSLAEVIKRSEDKEPLLRQLALKSLSKFSTGGRPNPRILQVLQRRLGDTDKVIRRSAAFALARIKDSGVTANLVKLKDDPDGDIREQVAVSLTHTNHPEANAILVKFLDDSHAGTKRAAADGVRVRKIKSALQKLKFLVQYRNVDVRRAVFRAIYELGGVEGAKTYFGIWQAALFDTDPKVKIWAARGISQKRDPRVPGLLDPLVSDASLDVQLEALSGLAASGQPSAVEYIAKGLMDPKKAVKKASLEALAKLNLEAGKKPIMEFVKNESDKELVKLANDVYDKLP